MAAKKVPFTTSAQVPSTATSSNCHAGSERPQPIEHDEQRSHERFQHDDENKIAQRLGEKQRVGRSGRYAVSVEHLVANLPRPGLVERHHRREQECHPDQAARDLPRFFGARIKRKTEHDHHQQRKKQHGVDGVLRPPLQAKVFEQRGAGDAGGRGHFAVSSALSPNSSSSSPPFQFPRAPDNLAEFHPDELIGRALKQRRLVSDDEDRCATVARTGQQLNHLRRGMNVHIREGLIEQKDFGVVQ